MAARGRTGPSPSPAEVESVEATDTQRLRLPTDGPHDADALGAELVVAPGTLDFGAIRAPVPVEGSVEVEPTTAGRIRAVHITLQEGRLSMSALAAPLTGGLWPEIAAEIHSSLREGGARVRSFTGEWGRELHATTDGKTSVFVGIDGPRWMLYGVATGPTPDAVALDARLRRMLRGSVVVRGRAAYPVRTVLPLTTPGEPGRGEAAAEPRYQSTAERRSALLAPPSVSGSGWEDQRVVAARKAGAPPADRAVPPLSKDGLLDRMRRSVASGNEPGRAAPGVFINYRRKDQAAFSGRLFDRLVEHFGRASVFIDVDSIELGVDFADVINATLSRCSAVVVVIGADWLRAVDEQGERRLDHPDDYVRLEIELALQRNIPIIPVLVENTPMPMSTELPPSLRSLARRNGLRVTNARFGADIGPLLDALRRLLR